jgi:hypothetical protein
MKLLACLLLLALCACQQPESAAEDFPNLKPPPRMGRWHGSVGMQPGLADGPALVFRLDPDSSAVARSPRYVLWLEPFADSLRADQVYSDTMQVCEGGSCRTTSIEVTILVLDSTWADAEFTARDIGNDSTVSGIARLQRLRDYEWAP